MVFSTLGVFLLSRGDAQNITNLAGIWNGLTFGVPTQLQAQFENGVVTNVIGHDAFSANTFQVHAFSDGTFTNEDVTGTISLNDQGTLMIYPAGSPSISLQVNSSQDIFAGTSTNSDGDRSQNDLNIIVRSPSSFVADDLSGTWQMIAMVSPEQLVQSFLPTTNGSALTDLAGLDNQSVNENALNDVGSGYITFNSDGTFAGSVGDPFSGTYTVAANGECDLNINPSGGPTFPLACFINASKDTMIALLKDNTNNRQQLILMTKPPTDTTLADLQGAWKINSLIVPDELFLSYDASNFVTSISTSSDFRVNQQAFVAGHDGFLTGIFDDHPSIGSLSVTADGVATVTFTNLIGETRTNTAQLNAGKNCLTLVDNDGSEASFTVATKSPIFPSLNHQNFGLLIFGTNIYWAAGTTRILQTSSMVDGPWTNISTTLGNHQFSPSQSGPAGFFRVNEQ